MSAALGSDAPVNDRVELEPSSIGEEAVKVAVGATLFTWTEKVFESESPSLSVTVTVTV